ncbi:MAG: hypothetical protein R2932_23460 [Caldilineaceae bacterium]
MLLAVSPEDGAVGQVTKQVVATGMHAGATVGTGRGTVAGEDRVVDRQRRAVAVDAAAAPLALLL